MAPPVADRAVAIAVDLDLWSFRIHHEVSDSGGDRDIPASAILRLAVEALANGTGARVAGDVRMDVLFLGL